MDTTYAERLQIQRIVEAMELQANQIQRIADALTLLAEAARSVVDKHKGEVVMEKEKG